MSPTAAVSPIAGVHPTGEREATVAIVWPSIAAGPMGRMLGRLYALRAGVSVGGVPLTLGWLLVILTGPVAAVLFLTRIAPRWPLVLVGAQNAACVRYRVTNRRVVVEHPIERAAAPVAELALDRFDRVEIDELPGQSWFHAADVVLAAGGAERLRLAGVPRPVPFRELLLRTQRACATTV